MHNRLKEIVRLLPQARILCIGDIMLDRFVRGVVERISPETPVPVLRFSGESIMPGGAGNVAANLRALGCPVLFLGVTGKDAEGDALEQLLSASGVRHCLARSENWITTVKTRFVADNHHLLRFDKERRGLMSQAEEAFILQNLNESLAGYDAVLLSDYDKGLLTDGMTRKIIAACRTRGKPVMVDPKGADYGKYSGAFLIKPNCRELEDVSRVRLDPKSPDFIPETAKQAANLAESLAIEHVVVTLGSQGMLHVGRAEPAGSYTHLPTLAKEVFDVSGAGDTSFAALGASIAVQASVNEAIRVANMASGIVVGKLGTATVDVETLLDYMRRQVHVPQEPAEKIMTLTGAAAAVRRVKSGGKSVGLTNGCFDMLHRGHLHSLFQAKRLCDFLVVAVNSDASVRRLKGAARPLQDECTRCDVLAAMECVDLVVLFDDSTAAQVVDALRPDVIAKEGYSTDNWPEARQVMEYGGKAVTLDRLEGYSTSALLQKITDTAKDSQ